MTIRNTLDCEGEIWKLRACLLATCRDRSCFSGSLALSGSVFILLVFPSLQAIAPPFYSVKVIIIHPYKRSEKELYCAVIERLTYVLEELRSSRLNRVREEQDLTSPPPIACLGSLGHLTEPLSPYY